VYVCAVFALNLLKMSKVRGKREVVGLGGGRSWLPPVARAGSCCPGLDGGLWWCWSRRRR